MRRRRGETGIHCITGKGSKKTITTAFTQHPNFLREVRHGGEKGNLPRPIFATPKLNLGVVVATGHGELPCWKRQRDIHYEE